LIYHKIFGLSIYLISSAIWALTPFSAEYAADFNLPFNGSAKLELQHNNNNWQLDFAAGLMMINISESSTFNLHENRIISQNYHYERTGMGKKGNRDIRQSFTANQINIKKGDKSLTLTNKDNILDKSSYKIALQQDLAAGKTEFNYQILDVDDIETYSFKVIKQEEITTKLGKFEAIRVERVRSNSNRQTVIWFAPKWDFLLIKLEQTEKDGKSYAISLKKAQIDGKKVKGN